MLNSGKTKDSLDQHLQEVAAQSIESIDSSSTPTDYYNLFKKLSASEFLQTKEIEGFRQGNRNGDASIQQTLGYAA